jgi:hypothetical protein
VLFLLSLELVSVEQALVALEVVLDEYADFEEQKPVVSWEHEKQPLVP